MRLNKMINKTFIGLTVFITLACVSTTPATGGQEASPISGGIDLNAAVQEAATQMETRLPKGTMVAMVSVASPSMAFSEQVLTRLESAIVGSGKLVVVDRANLDKIRAEQGFQLSGEVDDDSAKSIGKLLGAGAIVTGSLTDLGEVYSLTLKTINIETATVAVSYLADLEKTSRIETLLAAAPPPAPVQKTAPPTAAPRTAAAPASPQTVAAQSVPAPTPAAEPALAAPPPAPTVYKVGDKGPAGGIVFYDKGRVLNGWRYLEAAPRDEPTAEWGANGKNVGGTNTGVGAGKRNTELILEYLKSTTGETGRAAQFCDEQFAGEFDDWFLPSKDELNLMYQNLKVKGLGGFGSGYYWSSSESSGSGYYALAQRFSNGSQDINSKSDPRSVRAIRQF
jgi:hypothetical protein